MKGTVLLMTSCFNPSGMKYTMLQNVEERRKQYNEAIKYYIEHTKFRIVFCDNSGEELSELLQYIDPKRVELLSFNGNDYDKSLGKGYGEFNIIRYAFKNSSFIKKSLSTIKVTGRLIVENLDEVKKLKDIIIPTNRHFVMASMDHHQKECDSRCFFANNDFYIQHFLNNSNEINDSEGYFFEHMLYDSIKNLPSNYIVSDFVLPLVINGISGTSGRIYTSKQMEYAEKLIEIRNFCKIMKRQFKSKDNKVYYRLSFLSFVVRVNKAVFNRIRCLF